MVEENVGSGTDREFDGGDGERTVQLIWEEKDIGFAARLHTYRSG